MSGSRTDVVVYTTTETRDRLQHRVDASDEAVTWRCVDDLHRLEEFIDRVASASEGLDFLFLLTVAGPMALPQLLSNVTFQCKTVTLVHNARGIYQYTPPRHVQALSRLTERIVRSVPARYRTRLASKSAICLEQRVVERADAGMVLYPKIEQHIDGTTPHPVVSLIPEYVHERTASRTESDTTRIVVPGRVNTDLRDYETVFDAVDTLATSEREAVQITLLGRLEGDLTRLNERIDRARDQGCSVEVNGSREWIPDTTFTRTLRSADVILAPLKLERVRWPGLPVPPERLGLTKTTGNIGDAIRYSLPLILPAGFPVDESLADGVTTYDSSDELADILRTVGTTDGLLRYHEEMKSAMDAYSRELQQQRFRRILDRIPE